MNKKYKDYYIINRLKSQFAAESNIVVQYGLKSFVLQSLTHALRAYKVPSDQPPVHKNVQLMTEMQSHRHLRLPALKATV